MASLGDDVLDRAAAFLDGHARLVERRLFELQFRDGDEQAATGAVLAYQNEDGGFGHALEPDLRVSTSQPIFTFFALAALRTAGAGVGPAIERACGFLASAASADGSIPYALPDALEHARAGHWNGPYALAPSLGATAGVAAHLHALGARHEWLGRATAWCVQQVESGPRWTGHTMMNTLDLLHQLPEHADLVARVSARLFEADYVLLETPVRTYGLTPLHFARTPDAPSRALFDDAVIEAHLDDLLAHQAEDGGWPITWSPPEGAAANEWRGRWTLDALETLGAYGRV